MVDVEYKPIQKIVVHEAIKYTLDQFVNLKAVDVHVVPIVRWIDGIVFTFVVLPTTPDSIRERVEDGAVHWNLIEFAEMPNHQDFLTNTDNNARLRVMNLTNNSAIVDVIRYFKSNGTFFPLGT